MVRGRRLSWDELLAERRLEYKTALLAGRSPAQADASAARLLHRLTREHGLCVRCHGPAERWKSRCAACSEA